MNDGNKKLSKSNSTQNDSKTKRSNDRPVRNAFMKKRNIFALIFLFYALILYILINYSTHQFWLRVMKSLPGHYEDPDIGRDLFDLIENRGFKYEKHFLTTPDGYILQTVRIVNPFVKNQTQYKPLLLYHGYMCTGTVYLCNNVGKLDEYGNYVEFDENNQPINGSQTTTNTLGFTLAAHGYDVWLANYRGSYYSSNHTHLSFFEPDYWKFSTEEVITIDIPMTIDYILEKTGYSSLTYIGYSEGNIFALALMSISDHYAKLMDPYIGLSPSWGFKGLKSPVTVFTYFKEAIRKDPRQHVFPDMKQFRAIISNLCSNYYMRHVCMKLFETVGFNGKNNVRLDRLPVYFWNLPSGASAWNTYQVMQMYDDDSPLRRWDFGVEENMKRYNQPVPPIFNVSHINYGKIALIYCKNDNMNPVINNYILRDSLKPGILVDDYCANNEDLDHMSFVWGKNAGKYFNKRTLELLAKYN